MSYAEMTLVLLVMTPMLSSENYHQRDAAFCALAKQTDMRILMFSSEDIEAKTRLRHLREKYYRDVGNNWYETHKNDELPWITTDKMNYLNHPLNDLKDDGAKKLFPRWRRATALYIRDLLWENASQAEIDKILDKLRDNERIWWEKQPMSVPLEDVEGW